MEYSSVNVEQAVLQFYQNPSLQSNVHFWLTGAQISPSAWTFCWELMGSGKSVEVQFYGASCLHVKIVRFWHEISPEQYEPLKSKLLEAIVQFASGPKVILTRLCVGLSALVLQLLPDNWPDAIHNLIITFQNESSTSLPMVSRCQILLEILTVLPEEFFSTNLSQHRRTVLRQELTKGLEHGNVTWMSVGDVHTCTVFMPLLCSFYMTVRHQLQHTQKLETLGSSMPVRHDQESGLLFVRVLPLLQSLLTDDSPVEVYQTAVRAFARWVDFGLAIDRAEVLIRHVFKALRNPQLFDIACDALVSVFAHPEAYKCPVTIQRLLPEVLSLHDMFTQALAEEEKDVFEGICRVVVSLCENHTKLIVESVLGPEDVKQNTTSLLHMILSCSGLPGYFPVDESCSDQTFLFWYLLQDELSVISEEDLLPVMEVFKPLFFSLIDILQNKARFPPDEDYAAWSQEEKEQFRCYRQDIADMLMYSYNVLEGDLLAHLLESLNSAVHDLKQQDWQRVEAILFVFSSVSESVPPEEITHLPKLFSQLQEIPFANNQQISTALNMIGSYAEWLRCQPGTLGCVLPLVLQAVARPELATSATIALKDITRESLVNLRPFAHQILSACQGAFEASNLKSRDLLRLMSSVGHVLSVMSTSEIIQHLDTMISPHIRQLDSLAAMEPSPSLRGDVHTTVNLFAWLFGSLDTDLESGDEEQMQLRPTQQHDSSQPRPIYVILEKISPAIQKIAFAWAFDSDVIEAVCDLYKKALQKLDNEYVSLAGELSQLVITIYHRCPNTAIIDLSKLMLLMFGQQENLIPLSKAIVENVCSRSLQMFDAGVRNFTDVIEGFMCFLAQVMKKLKKILLTSGCDLVAIFQAAVVSMALPEHATVKASCSFTIEFLSAGQENEVIKNIVITNGHILVDRILRAVGGESQRGLMDYIADVLMTLNKYYVAQMTAWLRLMLDNDGYPSPRASRQDKQNFIDNMQRVRINKTRTREMVKEFSLLCRGLLGTEYAESAAAFL